MSQEALVIYDGDCVFCQNYVRFFKLREAVGPVRLVDARSGDPVVEHYVSQGYDLDEGMLFIMNGKVHHGADAVNVLALLSSESSAFNWLNKKIFSSPRVSRLLYPLLKLGRRATLFVRGKKLIGDQRDLGLDDA